MIVCVYDLCLWVGVWVFFLGERLTVFFLVIPWIYCDPHPAKSSVFKRQEEHKIATVLPAVTFDSQWEAVRSNYQAPEKAQPITQKPPRLRDNTQQGKKDKTPLSLSFYSGKTESVQYDSSKFTEKDRKKTERVREKGWDNKGQTSFKMEKLLGFSSPNSLHIWIL